MKELEEILAASRAADEFKADVLRFCAGQRTERIEIAGHAPPVKITRLLKHMLSAEPHLEVERIALKARSGCSDFAGIVEVEAPNGHHAFEFLWDCRWRAEQEGWTDWFGFPDQTRAAQEFDWRCFREWRLKERQLSKN